MGVFMFLNFFLINEKLMGLFLIIRMCMGFRFNVLFLLIYMLW